tara:strand:- start:2788 stop:3090 length:303 start_codon:yes stop_codon:yes gene_type:complete
MVKKVNIGGEERPVKFGFAALMQFTDATGYTLAQLDSIGDSLTLSQAIELIKAGLKQGARVEGEKFNATSEEIADWLDESPEALEQVLAVFTESFTPAKK